MEGGLLRVLTWPSRKRKSRETVFVSKMLLLEGGHVRHVLILSKKKKSSNDTQLSVTTLWWLQENIYWKILKPSNTKHDLQDDNENDKQRVQYGTSSIWYMTSIYIYTRRDTSLFKNNQSFFTHIYVYLYIKATCHDVSSVGRYMAMY